MERLNHPDDVIGWLRRGSGDEITGYEPGGWPASIWILHAMYENPGLEGRGTYDDDLRRKLDAGEIEPAVFGDANLDERTTLTGIPLGFAVRPGSPWRRLRWSDYLARLVDFVPNRTVPPCFRWFPSGSWPLSIAPPPEGSLDQASLDALIGVLRTVCGSGVSVYAYYAALAAGDFDVPHVWNGALTDVPSLIADFGGSYVGTPTNLWPADRSWFVWTDWDLCATKVSGPYALIEAIMADPAIETTEWEPPA